MFILFYFIHLKIIWYHFNQYQSFFKNGINNLNIIDRLHLISVVYIQKNIHLIIIIIIQHSAPR